MFGSKFIEKQLTRPIDSLLNAEKILSKETLEKNQKESLKLLQQIALLRKFDYLSMGDFIGEVTKMKALPDSPELKVLAENLGGILNKDNLIQAGFGVMHAEFINSISTQIKDRYASLSDIFRLDDFGISILKQIYKNQENVQFSKDFIHPIASAILNLIAKTFAIHTLHRKSKTDVTFDIPPYVAQLLQLIVESLYLDSLVGLSMDTTQVPPEMPDSASAIYNIFEKILKPEFRYKIPVAFTPSELGLSDGVPDEHTTANQLEVNIVGMYLNLSLLGFAFMTWLSMTNKDINFLQDAFDPEKNHDEKILKDELKGPYIRNIYKNIITHYNKILADELTVWKDELENLLKFKDKIDKKTIKKTNKLLEKINTLLISTNFYEDLQNNPKNHSFMREIFSKKENKEICDKYPALAGMLINWQSILKEKENSKQFNKLKSSANDLLSKSISSDCETTADLIIAIAALKNLAKTNPTFSNIIDMGSIEKDIRRNNHLSDDNNHFKEEANSDSDEPQTGIDPFQIIEQFKKSENFIIFAEKFIEEKVDQSKYQILYKLILSDDHAKGAILIKELEDLLKLSPDLKNYIDLASAKRMDKGVFFKSFVSAESPASKERKNFLALMEQITYFDKLNMRKFKYPQFMILGVLAGNLIAYQAKASTPVMNKLYSNLSQSVKNKYRGPVIKGLYAKLCKKGNVLKKILTSSNSTEHSPAPINESKSESKNKDIYFTADHLDQLKIDKNLGPVNKKVESINQYKVTLNIFATDTLPKLNYEKIKEWTGKLQSNNDFDIQDLSDELTNMLKFIFYGKNNALLKGAIPVFCNILLDKISKLDKSIEIENLLAIITYYLIIFPDTRKNIKNKYEKLNQIFTLLGSNVNRIERYEIALNTFSASPVDIAKCINPKLEEAVNKLFLSKGKEQIPANVTSIVSTMVNLFAINTDKNNTDKKFKEGDEYLKFDSSTSTDDSKEDYRLMI